MNALYPLKFKPIIKETLWGGQKLSRILGKDIGGLEKAAESWEISGVQGNISVVSNGFLAGNNLQELVEVYMGDLVGERVYQVFGDEFPLLIKFIDANDILSIQVHPDDALSKKRHDAYGKTEMWYVIEADEGAQLISGFNQPMNKERYVHHLREKTLRDILNYEPVKAGDVFFIPAGRIHAIGPGILLAEIQQTSDVTYRIYDWDRVDKDGKSREMHTDLALDAIDYNHYDHYRTPYTAVRNFPEQLVQCDYFQTNLLKFDQEMDCDYSLRDSFVIYMCLKGGFHLQYDSGTTAIRLGETVMVPAGFSEVQLIPDQYSEVLEIFIP